MILPIKRPLLLLAIGVPAFAAQLPSPPPDSTHDRQIQSLLAQANDLAQTRFDNRRALALYAEALSLTGKNAEILWRISRSYIDLGEQLPAETDEEKEQQLGLYEKALEFAEKSVNADPGNSMSWTMRAIARARVTLFKGLWESVGLLNQVRDDLDSALRIDSTNHLAHFTLASTHARVVERPWIIRWPLGLGWGSKETALEHLEIAARLGWDRIEYRLACAHAYIEEEDYERARAHLSLIPMLRDQRRTDAEARKEARTLLDRIQDQE